MSHKKQFWACSNLGCCLYILQLYVFWSAYCDNTIVFICHLAIFLGLSYTSNYGSHANYGSNSTAWNYLSWAPRTTIWSKQVLFHCCNNVVITVVTRTLQCRLGDIICYPTANLYIWIWILVACVQLVKCFHGVVAATVTVSQSSVGDGENIPAYSAIEWHTELQKRLLMVINKQHFRAKAAFFNRGWFHYRTDSRVQLVLMSLHGVRQLMNLVELGHNQCFFVPTHYCPMLLSSPKSETKYLDVIHH